MQVTFTPYKYAKEGKEILTIVYVVDYRLSVLNDFVVHQKAFLLRLLRCYTPRFSLFSYSIDTRVVTNITFTLSRTSYPK